jgi:hypothetical protein
MSIWIVVIFVVLTIVGLVMVGIGFHEKTKHKDDANKPGKTYDILLYAGIALAVIGIIGTIWSMISYSKSKKSNAPDMGPPVMMGTPPPGMYGRGQGGPGQGGPGQGGPDYDFEMTSMSQGSPPPSAQPTLPQFLPLPDGRLLNTFTGATIPAAGSSMSPFGMLSQPSACTTNSLNLEEFMKAAKLLKELKDIING